jgi:hypothetical protein
LPLASASLQQTTTLSRRQFSKSCFGNEKRTRLQIQANTMKNDIRNYISKQDSMRPFVSFLLHLNQPNRNLSSRYISSIIRARKSDQNACGQQQLAITA